MRRKPTGPAPCGRRSRGSAQETPQRAGGPVRECTWAGLDALGVEEEGVGPQVLGSRGLAESGLAKGTASGLSVKAPPGEGAGAGCLAPCPSIRTPRPTLAPSRPVLFLAQEPPFPFCRPLPRPPPFCQCYHRTGLIY